MIKLSDARLTTLALHKVGSKIRNEGTIEAKDLYPLDEENVFVLQDYFLTPFKADTFYKFSHDSDLALNEIYVYCRNIFTQSRDAFLPQSIHILEHLYAQSVHPHIKSGELYVAHFRECEIDGVDMEAIGIFKSENKDVFLSFEESSAEMDMRITQGVNIKKLDKGCLIFNTYADDGYSVLMVNKSSEDTQYWRDDFLRVTRIQDNSFRTENYLTMAREFCEEVLAKEEDRKEQVLFLNKSLNYFSKNEEFDLEDFKDVAISNPDHKLAFDQYRQEYEEEQGLPPGEEGFPISKYAVRSLKKHFQSIIKLDSQIEIRLNTKDAAEAADFLERGFDEQRNMYYYKVYFNSEEK